MSETEAFKVDKKVLQEAMEIVAGNIYDWPDDEWVEIEGVIDLNMFFNGVTMIATIYPIKDRHTDTSRSIRIFQLDKLEIEE